MQIPLYKGEWGDELFSIVIVDENPFIQTFEYLPFLFGFYNVVQRQLFQGSDQEIPGPDWIAVGADTMYAGFLVAEW